MTGDDNYIDGDGVWDEGRFQRLILSTAFRGYSLDQVDDLLDQVVAALSEARGGMRPTDTLERLRTVELGRALRGYAKDEVEAALSRAVSALEWWSARI